MSQENARKQTDKRNKTAHHRDTTDVQPMDVLVMYQLFYLENQLTQTKREGGEKRGGPSPGLPWPAARAPAAATPASER